MGCQAGGAVDYGTRVTNDQTSRGQYMRDIIRAIRALIPLDVERWHRKQGGTRFLAVKEELTDADLVAHVRGEHAVATRHPCAMTEYLIFDIDAKPGKRTTEQRDEVYRQVTAALPAIPFVMRSPGGGLHVYFRILPTALADLPFIVAKACRAMGLPLKKGVLEIFPRADACFRVPFGAGSAVLDPATLEPIPGADLTGDPSGVQVAIDAFAAWKCGSSGDLVAYLRELAARPEAAASAGRPAAPPAVDERVPYLASFVVRADTGRHDLDRPHSRYEEEWRIGVKMWRFPSMFAYLGLPSNPTRVDVARALVAWLEGGAHGFSEEWSTSLRKGLPAARAEWVDRYLRAGADGLAPVDRMLRAALVIRANVTETESRQISAMSHTAFGPGIQRYRFEVWWTALLLHLKQFVVGAEGELHLCASFLRTLPYGRQYRAYLDILGSRGRVVQTREYLATPDGDRRPRARGYRVHDLDEDRHTDLDLRAIEDRLKGEAHHGRAMALAEAVHAIRASSLFGDLGRRYGAQGAHHVRRITELVQRRSCLEGF